MWMKRLVLVGWLFAACSGAGPTDAGVPDAGIDAGPECFGVPPRLSATCVGLDTFSSICGALFSSTVSAHFQGCDAGEGIVGYLGVSDCGEFATVSWTYGFPGDTYECFYPRDGGTVVGALNFSDHGVLAAGRVGDCVSGPPSMCRDGG